MSDAWNMECDVLIVGSGAGGMTAALTAKAQGLAPIVIEKSDRYGGTSAVSGGGIWIPCNHQMRDLGCEDSLAEAQRYVDALTGGEVEPGRMQAYLQRGRDMVMFMEERFGVRFQSVPIYPDYFPDTEGAKPGYRTMEPADFDAAKLGDAFADQREPYPGTLLMGRMAMNQVEAHVLLCKDPGWVGLFLRVMWKYFTDFAWRRKTKRDRRLVLGQALVGSLRHAMQQQSLPLHLNTGLEELIEEDGTVVGAVVTRDGQRQRIRARAGVVLACGGFESSQAMREQYLPQPTTTAWTAAPPINHGEGIRAGQALGAATKFMNLTWGSPTVVVPGSSQASGMFIERACPHSVMVNQQAERFCNEAGPYTEVVYSILADREKTGGAVPYWFICDATYRKKFPLGPIMPGMMQPDRALPAEWENSVYYKADSLPALAAKIGLDGAALSRSIERYNGMAKAGVDEDFHKGENIFDRYYGDRSVKPNPCLGPLETGPFYAVPVTPGELGTKGGLDADHNGQVLREDGRPIAGLYATGNCSAAVMGKTYAGPGATLGPAMTFGYLASLHMAEQAGRGDAKAEVEFAQAS